MTYFLLIFMLNGEPEVVHTSFNENECLSWELIGEDYRCLQMIDL